mgnify:CR=1 FL=1
MSKYKVFIPEHLRAYRPRPLRWLGKFLMKITGWKTTGHLPKDQRVVLIAGPHTSNWDFVLAMSLILSLDVHIHWVGKHSIFKKGFRRLLRKMGGIFSKDKKSGSRITEQDAAVLVRILILCKKI